MRVLTAFLALLLSCTPPASAQGFPLTIDHRFGSTTIAQRPERVASVDLTGADDLLALGVQPVVVREWFGGGPNGLWPWAAPLLDGTPELVDEPLDYERIARAAPDLIVAVSSGITARDYDRLSRIAPTVAAPEGTGPFALPWDARARIAGRAVGREAEAEARIAAIEARLNALRGAHPGWRGASLSMLFYDGDRFGAYTRHSPRVDLLRRLGFETTAGVDAATADGATAVDLSLERIDAVDADLVLWLDYDAFTAVRDLTFRETLTANAQGREILVEEELWAALAYSTLLSIPVALDRLAPRMERAMDGDPATPVTEGAD